MCNTARIFTHESNTCVIGRLAFLNLGFIDLLSCTRSLPPSTTSHHDLRFWFVHEPQNFEIALREVENFQEIIDDCDAVWHLGNRGSSKNSTKNKLVNRSWDKKVRVLTFGPTNRP